jgi:integrase
MAGSSEDYLLQWIDSAEAMGAIRPNTAAGYRSKVTPVVARLGDLALNRVKTRDISDMLAHLATKGGTKGKPLSKASLVQTRAILHRALADAVGPDGLPFNPVDGARLPKLKTARRVKTMSIEDARRFLDALDETGHGAFFRLAAMTGMRRSELGGLSIGAVDLDRAELKVERTLIRKGGNGRSTWVFDEPKTEKSRRTIALDAPAVDLLRDRIRLVKEQRLAAGPNYANNNLVFCNVLGEPLNLDALSATARRVRDRLGLPMDVLSIHGFRHLFGTQANKLGLDAKKIQAALGHSRVSTTLDYYVDVDEEQRREVADKMGALWR